ncbi:General transcription factor II-I repeat domain-containing protein 2A [Thelohanellus kitauei]|uniref:General transcription factor II-I repeat domain-containing protein 2A n=1 Tax=Thelohanellus kitauei TaxID=669202 RepID=A0A0C2N5I0_THEKT|nr:General transcription factor II-I repeat domain-containing protein 2A [Thelohanellus kitauei]KII69147.1 General transcription factor II-I repeat domain-containing protein 2A [Thelohanellus kitauei]
MNVMVKRVNFIRAKGLNQRQFNGLLEEVGSSNDLFYHTEVRWLSQGSVLCRSFKSRLEIKTCMEIKGCPVAELIDIMEHINELNRKNQGLNKLVIDLYESMCALESKLELWENQLSESNPFHFPTLKSFLSDTGLVNGVNTQNYNYKISALSYKFTKRFADFKLMEISFVIVRNPFSINTQQLKRNYKWKKSKFNVIPFEV